MAEETLPAATPEAEEVVSAPPPETKAPLPAPEKDEELLKPAAETSPETTKPEEETIPQSVSFKEESNRVSDLPDPEKKALEELKTLIEQALKNHDFTVKEVEKPAPAPETTPETAPETAPETEKPEQEPLLEETAPSGSDPPVTEVVESTVIAVTVDDDGAKTVEAIEETVVSVSAPPESDPPAPAAEPELPPEEVFIWGIPLLGDEKSDVLLLKFLRARDFKVKEAFTMIKNTVQWRKSFGIEKLLEEDLGNDLESVVFMNGFDKEGHPVCYNVYGEFQKKELYMKTFSDEEKRQRFLRWRIRFLEKGIRQLDFSPTGICTLVQVTDLKNSPGPGKRELRQATNQALSILQDNYPEFVAKQIFINVPWWYLAFSRMISPFLTQRTKSKFVFAGPSKSTETLFKYIAPEQVPVQYGGLSKEKDPDFSTADAVTELTIKPASKHIVEIPVTENSTLVWELRVLGWDVTYGAEFVPGAEEAYTVIIEKSRKIPVTDEPVIKNTFKVGEPGKVVLTIDNTTSKKKKILYRTKTVSSE